MSRSINEQIAQIISRALTASGEVLLPNIGSLYIEKRAAVRISKRQFTPPHCVVVFTSQERGVSLIELISDAIKSQIEDAAERDEKAWELYNRWLQEAQDGEKITILGVGTIAGKGFTVDTALNSLLNPQGTKRVKLARVKGRFDWVVVLGIIAVVAALGFATMQLSPELFGDKVAVIAKRVAPIEEPKSVAQGTDNETVADSVEVTPATKPSPTQASATPDQVAEKSTPAPSQRAAKPSSDSPAKLTSGHSYVVYGVYSTIENAQRAYKELQSKSTSSECSIHFFGERFLVSAYSDATAERAQQFLRQNRASMPDSWIYKAR